MEMDPRTAGGLGLFIEGYSNGNNPAGPLFPVLVFACRKSWRVLEIEGEFPGH